MTDAKNGTSSEDVVIAAAAVGDERGIIAEGAIAAQGDHALIVAKFADDRAARAVYEDLISAEIAGALDIDGVLVVHADDDGRIHVDKMTDHSTRTGLAWGVVGGVIAGVFLPATIVAGAVALGAAGAAAGKARNLAKRLDVEYKLKSTITPGTSGILALVVATQIKEVEAKMPAAEAVTEVPVDEETANAIKEAAAEASPAKA
jgi:uncharacterized membrane protein